MTTVSGAAKVDVLVIGAGQAGLAAARALAEIGVACVVHERYARIGDSWRQRFDSLALFTSREISALPGLPQSGEPRGFRPRTRWAATSSATPRGLPCP